MKVAIYSRKSIFSEKGESITNQIQLCTDYINSHFSNEENEIFIYQDEGYSGSNINRPKFKELINDANSKKFNCLICYRLDRISRNVSDFSSLIEKLNKLDISFISIKEQFDTSTPMGRAMLYISSVFAQLERETIAERVRDNMYELAKSGRWLGGTPPLGFNSTTINYLDENMTGRKMCKLEPDTKSLSLVKSIFDRYLKLRSLHKVNAEFFKLKIKSNNDKFFSESSLYIILRNPVYVKANDDVLKYLVSKNYQVGGVCDNIHGILTYAKNTDSPIASIASHEGIIDASTWLEVQNLLDFNSIKAPRCGTGKNTLLSGILKCSVCGSNMKLSYKKYNNKTTIYYVCGLKKLRGACECSCKNIRADVIEPLILDSIKNVNIDCMIKQFNESLLNNKENSNDINSIIKSLNLSISEKEKQIDNLVIQLSSFSDSSASSIIVNKIEELNKEVSNLKLDINNLSHKSKDLKTSTLDLDELIKNLNNFNQEINKASLEQKRLLVTSIIESIVWDSSCNTVTINYIDFNSSQSTSSPQPLTNTSLHISNTSRSPIYERQNNSSH